MDNITIKRMFDAHCHFRLEPMLSAVLPFTVEYCAHAIAMPNTRPREITSTTDVMWYSEQIQHALDSFLYKLDFKPLMTIEIRDNTTTEEIYKAHYAGAVAGKVYPLGVTTNSDKGLQDFVNAFRVFETMQEIGMKLLLHGESPNPGVLVTDREKRFLPTLEMLSVMFPKLKIIMEHITTRDAVCMVASLPDNIAATITGHHLYLTLNDIIGSGIRPHNYCMPIAKSFEDRDALITAATSGNPKFFLGSDTAPHLKDTKETNCGCAGIFTAPVLPSILAELFNKTNAMEHLEGFTSGFANSFYGLKESENTITLIKEPWEVPLEINGIVPFMAGETLEWKLIKE